MNATDIGILHRLWAKGYQKMRIANILGATIGAVDWQIRSVRAKHKPSQYTQRPPEVLQIAMRNCLGALCRDKPNREFRSRHKGERMCSNCRSYADRMAA